VSTQEVTLWFEVGWYAKTDSCFLLLCSKHCVFDHISYVLYTHGDTLIFVVYVENILITSNNNDLIHILKKQLTNSFDITDLGTLHYFLGLQVLPLLV